MNAGLICIFCQNVNNKMQQIFTSRDKKFYYERALVQNGGSQDLQLADDTIFLLSGMSRNFIIYSVHETEILLSGLNLTRPKLYFFYKEKRNKMQEILEAKAT